MRRIAVVMAGGSGERFWPLSRMSRPKQLLKLTHPELSMLQEAVARAAGLAGDESVFIATSKSLEGPIAESSLVPPARLFAEPLKRNTLGALAWTTAQLISLFPQDWMGLTVAVLTADHKIGDSEVFLQNVRSAMEVAESTGGLVTIGIAPTRAETGFGYIEVDGGPGPKGAFKAKSFREKPDLATAEEYVRAGRFYWNSGMFFWTLRAFFEAVAQELPEVSEIILQISQCLAAKDEEGASQLFSNIPSVSVDYALMEKASNVYVVKSEFSWDDVGAWDALQRALPTDSNDNVISGNVVELDSRDCILLNDSDQMTTCVLGLTDLVVVTTKDAVLVCPKSRAQEIRRIVAELKKRGSQAL